MDLIISIVVLVVIGLILTGENDVMD